MKGPDSFYQDTFHPDRRDREGRRIYTLNPEFSPAPVSKGHKAESKAKGRTGAGCSPITSRRSLGGFPGRRGLDQPSRERRDSTLHVRRQCQPSWTTPAGVRAKLRQLEAKGLPDMCGWRFITLTIDPELFGNDPETAFLVCSPQVRRFIEAGKRAGLWDRGVKWARKLEFQSNGWAHWHIPLARKEKFTHGELAVIRKLWKFGRTNVRRISGGLEGYSFKYVFKGVYQEGDERRFCLPDWFLDYLGVKLVDVRWKDAETGREMLERNVEKPDTFGRVRFWQTSPGFYVNSSDDDDDHKEVKDPVTGCVPVVVSALVDEQGRKVIACARDGSGRYVQSLTLVLSVDLESFLRLHLWDVENRAARVLSSRSFAVAPATIRKTTNPRELCQLNEMMKKNKWTLRGADVARREGKDLTRC